MLPGLEVLADERLSKLDEIPYVAEIDDFLQGKMSYHHAVHFALVQHEIRHCSPIVRHAASFLNRSLSASYFEANYILVSLCPNDSPAPNNSDRLFAGFKPPPVLEHDEHQPLALHAEFPTYCRPGARFSGLYRRARHFLDAILAIPRKIDSFHLCACDSLDTLSKKNHLKQRLDRQLLATDLSSMNFTDFHAKLVAHELTRRCATGSVDQLASVLADAQVDLNPHQIEAALFALSNPLSKGVILADEVGLGKTIEAGLLLSQKWAERRRRLLVITPANLRKQWSQELEDKFHLPSVILEKKSFNEAIRDGNLNPFQQNLIVICSYQFIKSQEPYVKQANWDLVVVDEAHRLRNVYKASSKIARSIKDAISVPPKVLLTATPLQNSLLELYGLVSIIDEFTFGDQKSFQSRFIRLADKSDFEDLKKRLAPICKRTLRKQVLEYIKYTNRHAIVQEFIPSNDEQQLYDKVSEYLQGETLYALPSGQRQLMTLTGVGSTRRWPSSTGGPMTAGLRLRSISTISRTGSNASRQRYDWRPRCRRNWTRNVNAKVLRQSGMRRGRI